MPSARSTAAARAASHASRGGGAAAPPAAPTAAAAVAAAAAAAASASAAASRPTPPPSSSKKRAAPKPDPAPAGGLEPGGEDEPPSRASGGGGGGGGSGDEAKPSGGGKSSSRVNKSSVLEKRLRELEDENRELRLQLKVGKETAKLEQDARREIVMQMKAALGPAAPGAAAAATAAASSSAAGPDAAGAEDAIASLLREFVIKFSDYGDDRTRSLDKHLEQLERLLKPTRVTKMALWMLHQDDDFFKLTDEDAESLWQVVCRTIEASQEQIAEFKMFRENARKMSRGLRVTLRELDDLRQRVARRNSALAEEMRELQDTLSPTQLAKFIVWCADNPASMALLNTLWAANDQDAAPGAAATSASTSPPPLPGSQPLPGGLVARTASPAPGLSPSQLPPPALLTSSSSVDAAAAALGGAPAAASSARGAGGRHLSYGKV